MKAKPLIYNKSNSDAPYVFDRNTEPNTKLIPRSQIVGIIKRVLTSHFEVTDGVFSDRCRRQEYVLVRQLFAYFLYTECPSMSLLSIGAEIGGAIPFDHSTVNNSLKKISDRIETDSRFLKTLNSLSSKINSEINSASETVKLSGDYYSLDMDSLSIFDIKPGKAVVFVGLEEHEIRKIMMYPEQKTLKLKRVINTGFRILRKAPGPLKKEHQNNKL